MIEFHHVTKTFAGVTALSDVSLSIRRGECHALMGENGAGKSTLGKVLAGIHRPNSGEIRIDGSLVRIACPADAARAGVGMVHQELAFCPDLSVAENLAMGRYPRWAGLFVRRGEMEQQALRLLGRIGAQLDVRRPMRELSTAQEQLVQIAAAVGSGASIIVFDEPTSSLSEVEAQRLFALIESLKGRGVTVIYVSHRMPEVFRLADRISVLRDGRYVGTVEKAETSEDELVRMMIGRSVSAYVPQHLAAAPGPLRLQVERLSSPRRFESVSLELRSGEIVGLAGLVGAGRSELAQAIFGLDAAARGVVRVDGSALRPGDVRNALHRGVGLVPEDRKRQGLVLQMSGRENCSMVILRWLRRFLLLDRARERRQAADLFAKLAVKTPSIETAVANLSGGNQQKVVIAKWLARKLNVLIVDEPTRGVDVGAKAAIHALLDDLARQGLAILLISSELPEIVSLSTRVLVMREGRIVGHVPRAEATQERLMALMAGVAA
ncbi:Ribose import ATP-binding protein RbsA [Phycisphaerae bacterium RAS1]|nr:Ribose import ATP-binding protein RbsA [Phycisphaerae bacterium RAS1]